MTGPVEPRRELGVGGTVLEAADAGFRSYAGFGIRDPGGAVVGVCAVMDHRPRDWTPEQLAGVAARPGRLRSRPGGRADARRLPDPR